MHSDTWQLQEAKAKLSEVVRSAKSIPQYITLRGEEEVVMLSVQEYKELKKLQSATENKKPKNALEALRPPKGLKLSNKEVEQLFGRDRSIKARRTDDSLFD